ncbi:MAG: hypothetical protein QM642_01820 [Edaphocola sp.]
MKIDSKRRYRIVGFEMELAFDISISLNDILNEDTEVAYSLQEQLDDILDMRIGDVKQVIVCRNRGENGLIKRID